MNMHEFLHCMHNAPPPWHQCWSLGHSAHLLPKCGSWSIQWSTKYVLHLWLGGPQRHLTHHLLQGKCQNRWNSHSFGNLPTPHSHSQDCSRGSCQNCKQQLWDNSGELRSYTTIGPRGRWRRTCVLRPCCQSSPDILEGRRSGVRSMQGKEMGARNRGNDKEESERTLVRSEESEE